MSQVYRQACDAGEVSPGPLSGRIAGVSDAPAARMAGVLLSLLGALASHDSAADVSLSGCHATVGRSTAADDWARTGFASPAAPVPVGSPATLARALTAIIEALSMGLGSAVHLDGAEVLGQRAKLLRLPVAHTRSAGGAARLLAARDGWFALNLPRRTDEEMIPALIQAPVHDVWSSVRAWAAIRPLEEIEQRMAMLGLAVGALNPSAGDVVPWRVTLVDAKSPSSRPGRRPLVVNLGSLWAAPLCAQILHRAGLSVVDVESPQRPDGARSGTPAFYADLHAGHELAILDLHRESGRDRLRQMIDAAEVVITASRSTGLRRLGAVPAYGDHGRPRVWIRITAHGSTSDRVGFGDDAAVAGGLVAWHNGQGPFFAGDAIADPLTGLSAAATALACLAAGGQWQVDLALRDVAAFAARIGPDVIQ
jgi:hypothetical protein